MRNHYWTCSKLANLIRGTKKPNSETCVGWANWRKDAKVSHPIRFWLADTGLDIAQNIVYYIPDKFYNIRCYLDNRFVSQTHALVAHKKHIKRGQWADVSSRFLPCLFDTLVDFVEIELASELLSNKNYKIPIWYKLPFMHWRSREAGIENLKWQMALICDEHNGYSDQTDPKYGLPTEQAKRAAWILSAYLWWKDVYPNRSEPMKASGWDIYCTKKQELLGEDCLFSNKNIPKDLKKDFNKSYKLLKKIEKQYKEEDTKWMKELIENRHSFWT